MNLLDITLLLSGIAFLVVLTMSGDTSKKLALAAALIIFLVSLGLLGPALDTPAKMTFETNVSWIEQPAIRYHTGIDGVSVWLIILTTLLTPISMLVSWNYIKDRVPQFYAFLLLLEFGLIGVFMSLDLFLFYVFWEICLGARERVPRVQRRL